MAFTPSHYQQAIFDWIRDGSGHAVVDAVAGSGKTTTLVAAAEMIRGNGLFLAFNVKIAEELAARLEGTGMTAINSHKVGNRLLAKHIEKRTLPNKGYSKWRDLCQAAVERIHTPKEFQYQRRRALSDLASKVMVNLIDPYDFEALEAVALHHDIEGLTDALIGQLPAVFAEAETITRNTGAINFDEMIYYPVMWGLQPAQYDWVFVDEAQDLNKMQQALAKRCIASGGRSLWVGDRRQAIYGFAGADHRSFASIQESLNAVELPLSVNYRCPSSHLDLVRNIVPHIEAHDNATEGIVEYIKNDDLQKHAKGGDMVVCRVTAPLVSECIQFIRRRQPARVLGKDIGAQLIALLDKIIKATPGFQYDRLVEAMSEYERKQVAVLSQKEDNAAAIERLHDQIETLEVCATDFGCDDLDCLKAEITALFEDAQEGETYRGVTLCTVHKAKGLENDTVFILKPDKMPLVWDGQQAWEYEQELNIRYVALTRAKQRLVFCGQIGAVTAAPEGDEAEVVEIAADDLPQPATGQIVLNDAPAISLETAAAPSSLERAAAARAEAIAPADGDLSATEGEYTGIEANFLSGLHDLAAAGDVAALDDLVASLERMLQAAREARHSTSHAEETRRNLDQYSVYRRR